MWNAGEGPARTARTREAAQAYGAAAARTENEAERDFLRRRREALGGPP
ncbi:hypothetical protein OG937_13555 [Streptomyces sp. NBC_00510]